jgi:hypothetical protein
LDGAAPLAEEPLLHAPVALAIGQLDPDLDGASRREDLEGSLQSLGLLQLRLVTRFREKSPQGGYAG